MIEIDHTSTAPNASTQNANRRHSPMRSALIAKSWCSRNGRTGDRRHGKVRNTDRSIELVLKKPARTAAQLHEQEMCVGPGREIGLHSRPRMRAREIHGLQVYVACVVRIGEGKSHPALRRDSLRPHIPVEMIAAARLDGHILLRLVHR